MKTFNWEQIKKDMIKAFKLTKAEIEVIDTSPIFKILASIPFLANCEDADRCTYANLSALITSYRLRDSEVVLFKESDMENVEKRIQYLFNFKKGNKKIIEKGKALLKLQMLLDYKADAKADKGVKLNPVNLNYNVDKDINKLKKVVGSKSEYDILFEKSAVEVVSALGWWVRPD